MYGLVSYALIVSQRIHMEAEYWRKACSIPQPGVLEKEISVGSDSSSPSDEPEVLIRHQ